MSTYEFTVSLRIRHPTMDPTRITQALGIEPQYTWRAGEQRCDPGGAHLEGAHRDSYWMAQLAEAPGLSAGEFSIESLLVQTVSQLRRAQPLLAELHSGGGIAELHVSMFAREDLRVDLSAEVLAAFGRLGLALTLDVHLLPPISGSSPTH